MVCADDRIEYEIGPEPEHAQGVRIDRPVEQLREHVVRDAEREERKPHADRIVHVERLHGDLSEAMLVPRHERRHAQDRGETKRADRVPVGDVDLVPDSTRDRADDHDARGDHREQKAEGRRPDPFAVFLAPVARAGVETDRSDKRGNVEHPQREPSGAGRANVHAARPRGHPHAAADHRDRCPAVERTVRVDRAQPPERKQWARQQVRIAVFKADEQPRGRREQQPHGRRDRIRR